MRAHTIRKFAVLAVAAGVLALGACSDDDEATIVAAPPPPDPLIGTWSGTRLEGTPVLTLTRGPFGEAHIVTGSMTVTFTAAASGGFEGTISIDPDICWTANPADGFSAADKPQSASLTVSVANDRVNFSYVSPLTQGQVTLIAPHPPTVPWIGSYNGTQCGTQEDSSPWVGNFTLTSAG